MNNNKPRIYSPSAFIIPEYRMIQLSNGLKVYIFKGGESDTLKLEWCFKAGRSTESKQLVSKSCNSLIKEGSKYSSGYEISEYFDYYGSALTHNAGVDYNSYSFYCLGKYFDPLLEKFLEVMLYPSFPEDELITIQTNSISRLKQDMDDADFNSYRILTEKIFGSNHPYGYNSTEQNIRSVGTPDILSHWQLNYQTTDSFIIVAGNVTNIILQKIEDNFGHIGLKKTPTRTDLKDIEQDMRPIKSFKLEKTQSSVKIGIDCVSRQHDDFDGMFVFNTVLGGYFNSRLNNVIREAKGLTYNIFSTHDTYLYGGLFYISADTSQDQVIKMNTEIYTQIDKLLDKPIPKAELERVRGYLLGTLMTSFDGVYNCVETLRSCLVEGVDFASVQQLINKIATIETTEVMETGRRNLSIDNLIEVVIG